MYTNNHLCFPHKFVYKIKGCCQTVVLGITQYLHLHKKSSEVNILLQDFFPLKSFYIWNKKKSHSILNQEDFSTSKYIYSKFKCSRMYDVSPILQMNFRNKVALEYMMYLGVLVLNLSAYDNQNFFGVFI